MNIDTHDLLHSIMTNLDQLNYIKPEEVPNIDLYMDQVTTFMDEKLRSVTRNPEDDKIMTKTMINNYAKNKLIPAPDRKKYTKEHMLLLIFIYYFKGIMSIGDIQTLLDPLTEKYFSGSGKEAINLETIYREVFSLENESVEFMKRDVIKKFHMSQKTFSDVADKDKEFLQLYSFICTLAFDVYVKKLMIEKMIDSMREMQEKRDTQQEKKSEKAGQKK
ncbi:MAG: DUF1836 domain-containing protein [Lachnospiraceae bacterium]|nr:DUF1836 domain-containing protein [Lachnospiraceae bacterium]